MDATTAMDIAPSGKADVDTAIIFTKRMKVLADFYAEALQLGQPELVMDAHIGFRLPSLYLGFDQVDEDFAAPGNTTLWFRVADLDATFQRIVALGATIRYAPLTKPWGDRLASVYDLDGNMLGLAQRRKQADT